MNREPNQEQLEVINELENNLILFASAGTGKTFTVANRIKKILSSGKAAPEEILCITFTVKACREMSEDICTYVGNDAKKVNVNTIHGCCLSILKTEAKRNSDGYISVGICDDIDEEDVLRTCAAPFSSMMTESKPSQLRNIVSMIKHRRYELDLFTEDPERDYRETIASPDTAETLRKLCTFFVKGEGEIFDEEMLDFLAAYGGRLLCRYDSFLRESNLVDFDDIIIAAAKKLKDGETRAFWRKKYKYIIIDEMQDTSTVEYDALESLFAGNHVMMCGDFFQTIYAWRGSDPEKILNGFIRTYHAKVFMFGKNYRATKTLAEASFGYLKNTYPELMGRYCPQKLEIRSDEKGEPVRLFTFGSMDREAEFIYRYLADSRPADPSDVCIMARSNHYIADLYERLRKYGDGLPADQRLGFFTVEKEYAFYRTAVVKDLLAFLRVLVNDTDEAAMDRILSGRFIRGMGKAAIEKLHASGDIGVSVSSFLNPDTYEFGDCYAGLTDAVWNGNIVVYDTETTGLDLSKDQAIQIAAVKYDLNGEPVETFNRIVIPTVEISQGARDTVPFDVDEEIRLHGIPAKEAYTEFSEFVKDAVLAGHNSIRFDAPLIARQLTELGLPKLPVRREYDTMSLAKQFYPLLPNFKLSTLCEHFEIVNEDAHNAFGDVKATGAVLFRILHDNIIPTQTERRKLISQYAPRIENFFRYTLTLQKYIEENDVCGLFSDIISRCRLREKYKTDSSRTAMDEIESMIRGTETENAAAFLQEFIADAALSGSQIDSLLKKLNKIPIITVHQAKGCEFDTVIIAGCDNMNFPSFAAAKNGNEDEEKRVFYVAISRAKKKLLLTCCTDDPRDPWKKSFRKESPYISSVPGIVRIRDTV